MPIGMLTASVAYNREICFSFQKYKSFILEITVLHERHKLKLNALIKFIIKLILVGCQLYQVLFRHFKITPEVQ